MRSIIGKRGEREPAHAFPGSAARSKKKRIGGVTVLKLAVILAIYAALISVSSADQAYLGEKELRDLIVGNTVHGQGLQTRNTVPGVLRPEWNMAIGTIGNLTERYLVDQVRWCSLCC